VIWAYSWLPRSHVLGIAQSCKYFSWRNFESNILTVFKKFKCRLKNAKSITKCALQRMLVEPFDWKIHSLMFSFFVEVFVLIFFSNIKTVWYVLWNESITVGKNIFKNIYLLVIRYRILWLLFLSIKNKVHLKKIFSS
jgi:hypothetical protein